MASTAIAFVVVTIFWAIIGAVVPWFIKAGPNKGIIQTMLIMTAFCCYLFWLCAILMQLNPLIGPQLDNTTVFIIQNEWKWT